jgi:hypothetical protein
MKNVINAHCEGGGVGMSVSVITRSKLSPSPTLVDDEQTTIGEDDTTEKPSFVDSMINFF